MESINQTLFLWFNAPANPLLAIKLAAEFFATYLIFLLPLTQAYHWLRHPASRPVWVGSLLSILLTLSLNQIIGLFYQHPRPFMAHEGHTLISHVADSSFPSDHLSVIWSTAVFLCLNRSTRRWGVLWLLLGIPVAWSRIYLGVHYPMDMAGAFAISLLTASAVRVLPLHTANRLIETAYHRLLAYPIKKGWLPE